MTFDARAAGVDVEAVMRQIRARIEDKRRRGLLTDAEVRDIAEHPLERVLDAHDFKPDLLSEFRAHPEWWNYAFDPGTVYRSSRGGSGRILEAVRRLLRPVQKLFWNPTPMISALSRQSDLNTYYVHLLSNLTLEITRLNLEVQELKNRALQLQARLDLQARREKTLETMLDLRGRGPDERGGGGGSS
jgi:hypothetical protein